MTVSSTLKIFYKEVEIVRELMESLKYAFVHLPQAYPSASPLKILSDKICIWQAKLESDIVEVCYGRE
jgi:hypothetical protein